MSLCKIYIIGFTIMLTSILLFLLLKGNKPKQGTNKFFSDILKESENGTTKWSQGRFYLLISLVFYFFILTLLSFRAAMPNSEIKNDTFEMVVSALQWVIALFAGYVFGAKGLKVLDSIIKYRFGSKMELPVTVQQEPQTAPDSNVQTKEPVVPTEKKDPEV